MIPTWRNTWTRSKVATGRAPCASVPIVYRPRRTVREVSKSAYRNGFGSLVRKRGMGRRYASSGTAGTSQ
ncbi:hypothetical protein BHE74_00048234 [Ensete ventricosum]|nr:hypothetical protein BHE74_00048234 [Ensete ventricosum]RZS02606.1 hypothetical protein BHM03_00032669 [Ensete ventricosum]